MKRILAVLIVSLLGLAVVAGPALGQQGKGQGKSPASPSPAPGQPANPYPPGQSGKCDPDQEAEHGGCPPGSPGQGKGQGSSSTTTQSTTSAPPGGTVQASGNGFQGNSKVKATAYSDPVELGVIQTDASGAFDTTLILPPELEPGAHTIKFTGTGADGQPRELQQPLVITGATLATSVTQSGALPVGVALLVLALLAGATTLAIRNRNNRRVAAEGVR